MRIVVQLGEPFWRTAGRPQVDVALARGATVADAFEVLVKRYPALAGQFNIDKAQPVLFVDDQVASRDSLLAEGAKLRVGWPISG